MRLRTPDAALLAPMGGPRSSPVVGPPITSLPVNARRRETAVRNRSKAVGPNASGPTDTPHAQRTLPSSPRALAGTRKAGTHSRDDQTPSRSAEEISQVDFPGPPGPGRERGITAQGSPRAVFRRALARGNLTVAEIVAREVGHIDLREALELTALVARSDRSRARRMGARWLERWLAEAKPPIDDAVTVAANLAGLGGQLHDVALDALRALLPAAPAPDDR